MSFEIAESALELRGVCKKYKDFSLENVSFSLPMGSIMGFIGENGAGKTTTLKAILNLIRLDGGNITILGHDSVQEERRAKTDIGVVFDDFYLYQATRARDLAAILRNVFPNWDGAFYTDCLRRFHLPETKILKDYSRGMRMKLSIAAALSHRPRLLLLDEATSGLDPVMRSEILDILLDFIQDEGHAVLLSSHITSDLERVADYITFIHRGRVVFSESKDDLLESYGVLRCGKDAFGRIDHAGIVGQRENSFGVEALLRDRRGFLRRHPGLTVDPASLDEIMVFYGKEREEE